MIKFLEQYGKVYVNLVIGVILLGSLVFLIFGDYLRLAGFLVLVLLIMAPGYLTATWPVFKNNFSPAFVGWIQLVIAFASYFNFLGSLDFYKNYQTWWYDLVLHFLNPAIIFILSAGVIMIYQQLIFHMVKIGYTVSVNLLIALVFSFLWEFYEFIVDAIFTSASMFGQHSEVYFDTLSDLAADIAGAILASWLIYTRFYGYILDNTVNYRKKLKIDESTRN